MMRSRRAKDVVSLASRRIEPERSAGITPVGGNAMSHRTPATLATPRRDELGLRRIVNWSGLSISLLPNGAIFAIEHEQENRRVMINQVLGSPIGGGMGRLFLRVGGARPTILPVAGPEALSQVGAAEDRFVWEGAWRGVKHRVELWLHPHSHLWLWRVEVHNPSKGKLP